MARIKGQLDNTHVARMAMIVSLPEFAEGYLSAKERDEIADHCPFDDLESMAAKVWLQGNSMYYLGVELTELMNQAWQLKELLQYNGTKQ